jgi:hypothetical protein
MSEWLGISIAGSKPLSPPADSSLLGVINDRVSSLIEVITDRIITGHH